MRERRNWERVAVTVSSQPLTKTVSVSLGFHRCADWLKTGREWYCCRLSITPWTGQPQMKLEEHSLQNEKKEANYEKILFPAGAAGGV